MFTSPNELQQLINITFLLGAFFSLCRIKCNSAQLKSHYDINMKKKKTVLLFLDIVAKEFLDKNQENINLFFFDTTLLHVWNNMQFVKKWKKNSRKIFSLIRVCINKIFYFILLIRLRNFLITGNCITEHKIFYRNKQDIFLLHSNCNLCCWKKNSWNIVIEECFDIFCTLILVIYLEFLVCCGKIFDLQWLEVFLILIIIMLI